MMRTYIYNTIGILCLLMFASAMMAQVRIVSSTNPDISRSDGSITVEARGSAAPFIIQLLDDTGELVAASDADFISGEWIFDGLSAGRYSIIASDKTGCELSLGDITLSEEERCSLEIIVTNLVHSTERGLGPCPAEGITGDNISSDGAIDVHVSGADGPISYSWQGSYGFSSTNQNVSDLRSGSYVLTVTAGECTATAVVLVSACTLRYGCDRTEEAAQVDIPEIIFGESVSPDNGQASGRTSIDPAVVSILDLAGYQYYWQDQAGNYYSSPSLDGLASGVYCFHILDGCGGHDQDCVELYDCSVDPITIDASLYG